MMFFLRPPLTSQRSDHYVFGFMLMSFDFFIIVAIYLFFFLYIQMSAQVLSLYCRADQAEVWQQDTECCPIEDFVLDSAKRDPFSQNFGVKGYYYSPGGMRNGFTDSFCGSPTPAASSGIMHLDCPASKVRHGGRVFVVLPQRPSS
jgi:hypothetical protein